MSYTTTVTGSYPRKEVQKDTLRKPSVSEEESFEMIKWAVKEQSDLGLDIITDGEGISIIKRAVNMIIVSSAKKYIMYLFFIYNIKKND